MITFDSSCQLLQCFRIRMQFFILLIPFTDLLDQFLADLVQLIFVLQKFTLCLVSFILIFIQLLKETAVTLLNCLFFLKQTLSTFYFLRIIFQQFAVCIKRIFFFPFFQQFFLQKSKIIKWNPLHIGFHFLQIFFDLRPFFLFLFFLLFQNFFRIQPFLIFYLLLLPFV